MHKPAVDGLVIVKGFLNPLEQLELISHADMGSWSTELKRRVQHFGYRYNYKSRRVTQGEIAQPIPAWGRQNIQQVINAGISLQTFDQMIINEYMPGQGISSHIDCISCFANEIVSISLGSSCVMTFSKAGYVFDLFLEPGDLLLMRNEARHEWRHQIKARKADIWDGLKIRRERRLSLTYRHVLIQQT